MDVAPTLAHLPNDTTTEAAAVQLSCLRRMSPLARRQAACRMSQRGRRLAMEAIRRHHPDADDVEIHLRSIELAYGTGLAADVRRWLRNHKLDRRQTGMVSDG